jgi:hypothetical protein
MTPSLPMAPELEVGTWLNAAEPPTLAKLRGRVVVLHAFQMLCPGCISHGLPQAGRIRRVFAEKDVAVLGLHTVFEHHEVMTEQALRVFVHEYRIGFPIGIDRPSPDDPVPQTMRQYGFRGTPCLAIVDRAGRLRLSHFGQIEDMQVGAVIGQLLGEQAGGPAGRADGAEPSAPGSRCALPERDRQGP